MAAATHTARVPSFTLSLWAKGGTFSFDKDGLKRDG